MKLKRVSLLFLFCAHVPAHGMHAIPQIYLEDINVGELAQIHNVTGNQQSRAIYKHIPSNHYYKIWCNDYILAPDFIPAFKDGFFQDTSMIIGIIMDRDKRCRGYIMPEGTSAFDSPILFDIGPQEEPRFALEKNQTLTPYKDFYKKLIIASRQTQYAFIDLRPQNLILIQDQCFLIDLESVRKISSLNGSFFDDEYLPEDYRKEVLDIKNNKS